MDVECHNCGKMYKHIGTHWTRNKDCSHPEYTQRQLDLVTGMLMGDGTWRAKPNARNPYMVFAMCNKPYLEWLNEKLGILSTEVTLKTTKEDSAKWSKLNNSLASGVVENYTDVYQLRTRSNPELWEFETWYDSGKKRFDSTLSLSPEILKTWYVCDGSMNWGVSDKSGDNGNIRLWSSNEDDRGEFLCSLFDEIGFSVKFNVDHIEVSSLDTDRMLEYMGDAPRGFGYKWESDSYNKYKEIKNEVNKWVRQ